MSVVFIILQMITQGDKASSSVVPQCFHIQQGSVHCMYVYSSTLYVGMAQGVSFPLYIGIGAKFQNTQKTGERRLHRAEYRTALL